VVRIITDRFPDTCHLNSTFTATAWQLISAQWQRLGYKNKDTNSVLKGQINNQFFTFNNLPFQGAILVL
jgi:hypothetical protein